VLESVRDVLDASLKSASIKKVFFEKLVHASKTGDMTELQKIALNSKHINDDVDGYTNALKRGAEIAREIFSYNNKRSIEQEVRQNSLKVAVRFSYIICGCIILSIVMQSL
jgi:hypothetical protein